MDRRQMLTGLAASALMSARPADTETAQTYLEIKTWRLHNSEEDQPTRVADYLEAGLTPALARAGARLVGAFSNLIGPDGPYYVTLAQYSSMAEMQNVLAKLSSDDAHVQALQKLNTGSGLPFVRVESSLLKSFAGMPAVDVPEASQKHSPRIFELRTYESQNFLTLARKVAMFNEGEMRIFQRLGMRPVFFGETIVGPKQPNLMYMLSYDDLAARDRLWRDFGSDPEWKKLSGRPELKDSEIVANISNVILRPLIFSAIQ
jgi:hypothetical protein